MTVRPSALRAKGHGFTLVELMITLVVLAVLAAIAVPSLREFIARQRIESIAKELATDLRYLRTEAIQRRRDVQILFGSGTDSTCYVLYRPGVAGIACDCARTDGLPTCGDPAAGGANQEFKTVVVRRDLGVVLSATPANLILGGFNGLPAYDQVSGKRTLQATVKGASIGGEVWVYTTEADLVVPQICSVGGHHGALPACPS